MPSPQKEEWDALTTNAVWNIVDFIIQSAHAQNCPEAKNFNLASLQAINLRLLGQPSDEFYNVYEPGMSVPNLVKNSPYRAFYFNAATHERLDFIELLLSGNGDNSDEAAVIRRGYTQVFNSRFERYHIAYRIINGQVTDITDEQERKTVEEAGQCSTHIGEAINSLYNRDKPNYANVIRQSIFAVEEVCKDITGKPKATLADCLRVIDDKAPMHGALKQALTKLYGYTSDEGGIRHAGLSGGEVAFEEAKFMLVACSAFCNYLRAKQTKL